VSRHRRSRARSHETRRRQRATRNTRKY
jgi:hypothetical protein